MKLWTEDREALFRRVYSDRPVCVTGGAGFIGGHLTEALLNLGSRVTIIDDLSTGDAEFPGELIERFGSRARFVYASILEPAALRSACEGVEVVFHLAALGSVPRSIAEPERTMDVNLTGTVRVAEQARRVGARRWVFSSSSSVYGDSPEMPKAESMPMKPMSPYAASKAAGEHVVRAWATSYGLSGVCLRYFNVFGPRQSSENEYAAVIPAFIKAVAAGKRPTIYGDGSYSRDFTPVCNAVYANLLAGAAERTLDGQPVNIACGQKMTILELARRIASFMGRPDLDPVFAEARVGDIPHSLAALDEARDLLGFRPVMTVEEGLRDTVGWAKQDAEARAKAEPCG